MIDGLGFIHINFPTSGEGILLIHTQCVSNLVSLFSRENLKLVKLVSGLRLGQKIGRQSL